MDNHLTNIEIKNFKCFKDFKADGFKRINLIGGKNNIGKTAFMEACYVNVNAQHLKSFVGSLVTIKFMRENINLLSMSMAENNLTKELREYIELSNNIFTKSNINETLFSIEDIEGIKQYIFKFYGDKIKVNVNQFSYEMNLVDNIKFIGNFGLSNADIISFYAAIQRKKDEQFLNDILNKFDDRIESFKIMVDKPSCEIDGNYYEITEFGDGVRHLISIVTALFTCEDGYLFIDEIDNGIYYDKLDEIWTIIFEVSKRLNVQVFSTTHSKECIESFARVSKKLEDEDISYIKMTKLDDNSVMAGIRDYEMLQFSMEDGHEVRGW